MAYFKKLNGRIYYYTTLTNKRLAKGKINPSIINEILEYVKTDKDEEINKAKNFKIAKSIYKLEDELAALEISKLKKTEELRKKKEKLHASGIDDMESYMKKVKEELEEETRLQEEEKRKREEERAKRNNKNYWDPNWDNFFKSTFADEDFYNSFNFNWGSSSNDSSKNNSSSFNFKPGAKTNYSNNMTANQVLKKYNISVKKDWKQWLIKNKPGMTTYSNEIIRDVLNAGKEIFA